ncbi:MAG: primosomal protein N' [Chitinivibrionales bacterium]|nr:primosomal protein N' [Chitinivibrionales bacterium]
MTTASRPIVGVGFPIAVPGIYDYRIPATFRGKIVPGSPVLVQLQKRELWGVAIELKARSEHHALKPILDIKENSWNDADQSLISLYAWIAEYYQCELASVFKPLVRKKVLEAGPKEQIVYSFNADASASLTHKQAAALTCFQAAAGRPLSLADLQQSYGISRAILEALTRKKVLRKETVRITRTPPEMDNSTWSGTVSLTEEQQEAVAQISGMLGNPDKPFLLHGITGSGKTHVYIEIARTALEQDRGVIILVPEISLTPQTIHRFKTALGDEVAVIHSRMSAGERRDSTAALVEGSKRLVVGARSAILAPLKKCGLIIVDEEHDASYKQAEVAPRYHARDVAVMRGRMQQAVVVLGSATPSFESYTNAQQGKYHYSVLAQRFGEACLPRVRIVDMNKERRNGNWSPLSALLHQRISSHLSDGRQIILLLNRRGFSVHLICKDCGYDHNCPYCSVKLIYHRADLLLKCHQCGFEQRAPDNCPQCKGDQMQYSGIAIQKAEEYLRREFPDARLLRMDQDTTRGKRSHIDILETFAQRKADILLGTQMVAKGLDFAGVALVGVIQADTGFHLPDFRAQERTFQLLAQVSGRSGRGDNRGEVLIQTHFPAEPAVRWAQQHDYQAFYESEITARKELAYPPFTRLARIIIEGPHEHEVEKLATRVADALGEYRSCIHLLGPSPALLFRLKSLYRYSIILKSVHHAGIRNILSALRKQFTRLPARTRIHIDVDPVSVL